MLLVPLLATGQWGWKTTVHKVSEIAKGKFERNKKLSEIAENDWILNKKDKDN
jgi:hypothetical protein